MIYNKYCNISGGEGSSEGGSGEGSNEAGSGEGGGGETTSSKHHPNII